MNMESPKTGSIDGQGDVPTARLRILETTDLHMQLLSYDYFADRPENGTGLINLAGLIDHLRSEDDVTTLLFDNGDFIQGNPLADYIADNGTTGQVHPMIATMNALGYDAIALGNHEFNYGLPFLKRALADAAFPVTCANITHQKGKPLADTFVILERNLPCSDGIKRTIRIGVVGFVTPQITDWDRAALSGMIETEDIVVSARKVVPQIQEEGADIIVALCHSGIGASAHSPRMENAAVPLANVPGIDAILSGHTHEFFPGDSVTASDVVDPENGTLHGKPTVMAGFYGNWLGVIDVQLQRKDGRWAIAGHQSALRSGASTPNTNTRQPALARHVTEAHAATLAHIRQPIARTEVHIQSYFSSIRPDLSQQLLAQAQLEFVANAIEKTNYRDLPRVAATSPFRFGGRAGPGHYIDIAPGPFALRDAAAIYPFANRLCAIRCRGRQIRNWLERAASHFAQITPGRHDQPLINSQSPAYNSDTLYGFHYVFDLSAPARYGPDGTCIDPSATRLRDLSYQGSPIADDDVIIVATNSYRTNGGGGFKGTPDADILFTSTEATRDVLVDYLRTRQIITDQPRSPWRFLHLPDTSATFQSAPAAQHHLVDGITRLGPGRDGFDRYRFTF